MPSFTTRVELRGSPSFSDYEQLHSAMAAKGFGCTVEIGGKIWKLPHAEYDISANATAEQIREQARAATSTVWKDFLILVTEVQSRSGWLTPTRSAPG
jgi:hypothetical protein